MQEIEAFHMSSIMPFGTSNKIKILKRILVWPMFKDDTKKLRNGPHGKWRLDCH